MNDLVITKQGQALMAKMIAGTSTATFTKIATSDYDYSQVSELDTLTVLYDIKQEVEISSVSRTDVNLVQVLAAIDNKTVTQGYYIRGLGLYAKDSDNQEILYGIAVDNENPDYLPPYANKTATGIEYTLNTKVSNSEQVTIEISPSAVVTKTELELVERKIDSHITQSIYDQDGVHGLRYNRDEERLEGFDPETGEWGAVSEGGSGGIAPGNVTNLTVKNGNTKVILWWGDPNDTVIEGQTVCTWKGTKLVYKVGSYPANAKDGIQVLDNQERNKYLTSGYTIENLTNGETYYFALFPYSDKNVYNENSANKTTGKPRDFHAMTVKIDLSNSNPATCCTYADDAVNMTPGSDEWDEYFGHYPVLLKNGQEVGKLNPKNFDQFEDGRTVDNSSGNAGDVMIAFPRRGLKISTSGNIVTISMTDSPDDSEFEYNAHTRGNQAKDVFYLGAYKGNVLSNKLRSLKGKTPTGNQTIGTFRTQAQANGAGYENSGFYQLIFRQCMYILKYKNLNSQSVIGRGFVDGNSAATSTGGTEAWGMDSELIRKSNPTYMTDGKHHVKLFGLEDFWGNIWEWIDGVVTDSSRNILTANDKFNDTGSGYTNNGQGASSNIGSWMSKPQGKTKTGFLAKEVSGSESTYFCDSATLYASCVCCFGGDWDYASYAGAFRLFVNNAASYSNASIGGRLMYL